MYGENLKSSGRYARSNRAFVEAAINEYESRSNIKQSKYVEPYHNEREMVLESTMRKDSISNRYHSFAETVRSALVTETLYKILKESTDKDVQNDNTSTSIMRAMVTQYVNENGHYEILNRMKTASVSTSVIHNIITETSKKILESVDKSNPDTFFITPEMKDEFFKQLDYSDSDAISDAINQRVSNAMHDFVTANTKDHEDITAALQDAQEKIADIPEEEDDLREAYEMKGKRAITEIRNRPKGVMHSMVTAMCESVVKHPEMHSEFMPDGRLDMEKIVSRTSLMYTFMEMLNTSRIGIVDSVFIENTIDGLRK